MKSEIKKYEVFVSVSETECDILKGPNKNSIYPADWIEYALSFGFTDSFENVNELLETHMAEYICNCTKENLVDWKVVNYQYRGVEGYAGKMHVTCRNPFSADKIWHVYGWIRYCESEV